MSGKRPIYNSAGEVLYPGVSGEGDGYRGTYLLELATESWEESEAGEEWPLRCDVPLPEAKTGYTAVGALPGGYGKAARKAGMAAYCEARNGFIRFYIREKPPDSIRVQVTLLGDEDAAPAAGPVASGAGDTEARLRALETRLISQTEDPGEGSELETGKVLLVYE